MKKAFLSLDQKYKIIIHVVNLLIIFIVPQYVDTESKEWYVNIILFLWGIVFFGEIILAIWTKKDSGSLLKVASEETKNIVETKEIYDFSKIVDIKSGIITSIKIMMDDKNRKFVIKDGGRYSKIYNYTDLINYEIYENNNSVVQGTIGKTLIGGAFFGLGGMILGGNSKRKISSKCDDLRLIIRVNDINNTCLSVQYISKNIDKNSSKYKIYKDELFEIVSVLEYMMNDVKKIDVSNKNEISLNSQTDREKLEDLKKLLDEGIITQEEFEAKKKQILNL